MLDNLSRNKDLNDNSQENQILFPVIKEQTTAT
jgi:hypothetical protein